jgi:branched-chain amino acid transport system permease protein
VFFNGLTYGMIYAAVALALVLIWRATHILNFAQGAMAMFTTYLAVSLVDRGVNYWIAILAAIVAGVALGALVERVLVRPVENKPPLNAVILTLGLLILLEAVAGMIWGGRLRSFPANFSGKDIHYHRTLIALSPFDFYVIGSVLVIMALLVLLFRFTNLGLRMRAAAFEPEVARLLGVRVSRMLSTGWALAGGVGALVGVLVAPKVFLSPTYMDTILIYGFTAAILGGLESPTGALLGGLGMGLAYSYIGGEFGSALQTVGALAILIAVLMIRPQGIFSGISPRRV